MKSLLSQIIKVIGSQAFLAIVGLMTLPFIARGFGVEKYGVFSLFILTLGVVNNVEFGRVLLTREIVHSNSENEFETISVANVLYMLVVSSILGLFLFNVIMAAGLVVVALTQAMASPLYAHMCINNRIGTANMIRNSFWSIAYIVISALAFYYPGYSYYSWVFAIANLLVLLTYSAVRGGSRNVLSFPNKFHVSSENIRNSFRIILYNICSAANATTDRNTLKFHSLLEEFGGYASQADLSLKFNIFHGAVGAAIYPFFINKYKGGGLDEVTVVFSNILSVLFVLWFFPVMLMINYSHEIIRLVFGNEFSSVTHVYPLLVLGMYLNLIGFTIAPYLRAIGDFKSLSRNHLMSAISIIIFGLIFIPPFGLWGAAATALVPRLFDFRLLTKFLIQNWKFGAVKINCVVLLALALTTLFAVSVQIDV